MTKVGDKKDVTRRLFTEQDILFIVRSAYANRCNSSSYKTQSKSQNRVWTSSGHFVPLLSQRPDRTRKSRKSKRAFRFFPSLSLGFVSQGFAAQSKSSPVAARTGTGEVSADPLFETGLEKSNRLAAQARAEIPALFAAANITSEEGRDEAAAAACSCRYEEIFTNGQVLALHRVLSGRI